MMRIVRYICYGFLGILLIAFALENRQIISLVIPLTGQTLTMPMYIFFFAMLMLGTLFGSFISFVYRVKHDSQMRSMKRKLKAVENTKETKVTEGRLRKLLG